MDTPRKTIKIGVISLLRYHALNGAKQYKNKDHLEQERITFL